MDAIKGRLLVNPSGLDSIVHHRPARVRGALNGAIQIDGKSQWVEVTGPGHRYECFGDLSLCPEGKYIREEDKGCCSYLRTLDKY